MKLTHTKWLSVLAMLLITFAVLAGCNETAPPAVTNPDTDAVAVTDPLTVTDPETNTEAEVTAEPNEQTEPVTEVPTEAPTETLTDNTTEAPTKELTEELTEEPTEEPTETPTEEPTKEPTETPTEAPTEAPTEEPTEKPTEEPTEASTEAPTETPTEAPTETPTEAPTEAPAEYGHEIGDLCYDATLPLVGDQGSYTVSDGKGQVVILNFWGNWCPPCKSELPHFDQIADEYEGRVQVVTIHSDYAMSNAESYIQTNYPDSKMIFTYDEGDVYYDLLARDNAWPITFVLDEEGIIRNRFRGAITYNQLQNVLSNLLP